MKLYKGLLQGSMQYLNPSVFVSLFIVLLFTQKSVAQTFETGVYDRIDTIIIFDPETHIEQIEISKIASLYIDASQCDSLPKVFKAKGVNISKAISKELSALEFRCRGLAQLDWKGDLEVESFKILFYRRNKVTRVLFNKGAFFTEEVRKEIGKMSSGNRIVLKQILLAKQQKPISTGEFTLNIH